MPLIHAALLSGVAELVLKQRSVNVPCRPATTEEQRSVGQLGRPPGREDPMRFFVPVGQACRPDIEIFEELHDIRGQHFSRLIGSNIALDHRDPKVGIGGDGQRCRATRWARANNGDINLPISIGGHHYFLPT